MTRERYIIQKQTIDSIIRFIVVDTKKKYPSSIMGMFSDYYVAKRHWAELNRKEQNNE